MKMPKGLKKLLQDKTFTRLYAPTDAEIENLVSLFGRFGDGAKNGWREAFMLLRKFEEKKIEQ